MFVGEFFFLNFRCTSCKCNKWQAFRNSCFIEQACVTSGQRLFVPSLIILGVVL